MPTSRLAHAFVFVVDLERVAAFYAGAFGMRRENSSDAGFVIMRGSAGAGVAIHRVPPHVAAQMPITDPPRWRDDTAYKITFETDDLPAQRAAILAHGGQAKEPWSWEDKEFCECTDPEGNVVQIFHRVAADQSPLAGPPA
jgi:predicted enzyme related to lactoylglutathione lyase